MILCSPHPQVFRKCLERRSVSARYFIVVAKTYWQSSVLTCIISDSDWSACWNTVVDQGFLQIEVTKMFMPTKCYALKSIWLLPCWHVRELLVSLMTAVSAGFLISKLSGLFLHLPFPCKTEWHFNLAWSLVRLPDYSHPLDSCLTGLLNLERTDYSVLEFSYSLFTRSS